jgi:hypothetical protein
LEKGGWPAKVRDRLAEFPLLSAAFPLCDGFSEIVSADLHPKSLTERLFETTLVSFSRTPVLQIQFPAQIPPPS